MKLTGPKVRSNPLVMLGYNSVSSVFASGNCYMIPGLAYGLVTMMVGNYRICLISKELEQMPTSFWAYPTNIVVHNSIHNEIRVKRAAVVCLTCVHN